MIQEYFSALSLLIRGVVIASPPKLDVAIYILERLRLLRFARNDSHQLIRDQYKLLIEGSKL
jgi:hypothetical protein